MTKASIIFLILSLWCNLISGQIVAISEYSVNARGQVELTVESTPDQYYILMVRNDATGQFDLAVSMTLGQKDHTTISESLRHYPIDHYRVLEYSIEDPFDTDGDGLDDITEYYNHPTDNPLNPAERIEVEDGSVMIDSFNFFNDLSVSQAEVKWSEFLNGKRYSKYLITDFHGDANVYFLNGNAHDLHADFIKALEIDVSVGVIKKGQIVYHPTVLADNGKRGVFAWNYTDGHGDDFEVVQRTNELLAANMPFLENNLAYYITLNSEDEYKRDSMTIANSRLSVIFEQDVFGELDYLGLNHQEGYGFFREMDEESIPGIRDIVLFNSIPNSLPRIGGIITSVIQTPLSHVNLRAIQDNVPNAYIKEPLAIDSVAALLNQNIYYRVESDKFIIQSATQAQVDAWFADIRPDQELTPPLNLAFTSILPLSDISFYMFDGFGAKCANIATMQTFGMPKEVIPDGFGVPFFFYQEFMRINDLFQDVEKMLSDDAFMTDRNVRDQVLKDFRKKIKDSDMPRWMLKELDKMHQSFPEGTSIRCRSSTNNEDLPGFNGAGLYDSKTQHPHEGHIEKSIKQVYASLWNLRAFDEREFYRVNHFVTSMAVLCHPNFKNEKVNGVGVSSDPIYETYDSFYYLNTQQGEDLITNPIAASTPEEILLDKEKTGANDYILIRYSNQTEDNVLLLNAHYRDLMRDYLTIIHNEFEQLYQAENNETFAMEIEYKITSENQLVIKQARPWVSFESNVDLTVPLTDEYQLNLFPNPAHEFIDVDCLDCAVTHLFVINMSGEVVYEIDRNYREREYTRIDLSNIPAGIYALVSIGLNGEAFLTTKFVKN